MRSPERLTSEQFLAAANALWFEGEPEKAMRSYLDAIDALTDQTPMSVVMDVKSAYALCLCEIGQLEAALELYPDLHQKCLQNGFDETVVLRQWAKALEQSGDFRGARQTYEMIPPDEKTPQMDRLKWHHALGLLNWRDGRISEAQKNLSAATAAMPDDPQEAATVLAVLGNDALLSLEVGQYARAYRLADRMHQIYAAADQIPLSSEINFIKLRAALAEKRGDSEQEIALLRDGVDLLHERVPDDWMRRLDLVNEYVAALLRNSPNTEAVTYLSTLCDEAPASVAWIGRFMLARLQIQNGEVVHAKGNLAHVIASVIGSGSPESEISIVLEIANLCMTIGSSSASIFLGKLALKYLAEMAHSFDGIERPKILKEGAELTAETVTLLQADARYEEALALERLSDRIQRYAAIIRTCPTGAKAYSPVPFRHAELQAERIWLDGRDQIRELRETGQSEDAQENAMQLLETLFALQVPERAKLPSRTKLDPPQPGNIRVSLLQHQDAYLLHCHMQRSITTHPVPVKPEAFHRLVASMRDTVNDDTAWKTPARTLYDILIAPIADQLKAVQLLEVDASGILGRIPFCLLHNDQRFLAEQVQIRYVMDVAATQPSDVPSRQGLAHFAGFQTGVLANVPAALIQAGPNLKPASFMAGKAFTRQGLLDALATRPAYLSIAAHLDVMPMRPDVSALWLGSEEPLYLSDLGGSEYDLKGIQIALLATCSSSIGDNTNSQDRSLAALALEKGAQTAVGTLWDISEAAAGWFVDAFWQAYQVDPTTPAEQVLADLQAHQARRAPDAAQSSTASGGIGDLTTDMTPEDWAAFAVFGSCNTAQHGDTRLQVSSDSEGA